MQVDHAFAATVCEKLPLNYSEIDIIRATLAVAAERGLVVPDGVEWSDGILLDGGNVLLWATAKGPVKGGRRVRVAVVEIKE